MAGERPETPHGRADTHPAATGDGGGRVTACSGMAHDPEPVGRPAGGDRAPHRPRRGDSGRRHRRPPRAIRRGRRPHRDAARGTCAGSGGTTDTGTERRRADRAAAAASASHPPTGDATGAPVHPPESACLQHQSRRPARDPGVGSPQRLRPDDQSDDSSQLHLKIDAVSRLGPPRFHGPPRGGRCTRHVRLLLLRVGGVSASPPGRVPNGRAGGAQLPMCGVRCGGGPRPHRTPTSQLRPARSEKQLHVRTRPDLATKLKPGDVQVEALIANA